MVSRLAILAAAFGCTAAYLLPYYSTAGVWWRFIPSTLVILGTGVLVLGKDAARFFGLSLSSRDVLASAILFGSLLPLSYLVLHEVVLTAGLTAHRELLIRSQIHQLFQVFNDEILARAALLTLALRVVPHPKVVIAAVAGVFVAGHSVVYGLDGVEIHPAALITLFSLGVIANTLFVRFRHIGYGLALHYAWNFWRFNTSYYLDGRYLSEGETFNYVEGNLWVAAGSFLVAALVFGLFVKWARRHSHEPAA